MRGYNLKRCSLKPAYEKKYVDYLKRRYGMKRAQAFSKLVSS